MQRPSFWLQQARASRLSLGWFLAFVLAYALTLGLTAALMLVLWHYKTGLPYAQAVHSVAAWSLLLSVLFVVLSPILAQVWSGSAGLDSLLKQLGAQRVDEQSGDLKRRQLLDVCAEMSVAAMLPAPQLYIMMHEEGINAFVIAQGKSPCVLVLTQGALEQVNRAQLQALVAHEYSHLEAGDAALNMRLLLALSGLHAIDHLGRLLYTRGDSGEEAFLLTFFAQGLGMGLRVLGAGGTWLGRLIRAGISRQREYLADARAVQWTRHSEAVVDLLMLAQKHPMQGRWRHVRAAEFSHMCWVSNTEEQRWWATHPRVEDRIKAIDGDSAMARWRARQRQHEQLQTPPALPVPPRLAAADGRIDFVASLFLQTAPPPQQCVWLMALAGLAAAPEQRSDGPDLPTSLAILLPAASHLSAEQKAAIDRAQPKTLEELTTLLHLQGLQGRPPGHARLVEMPRALGIIIHGLLHWGLQDDKAAPAQAILKSLLGAAQEAQQPPALPELYHAILLARALEPFSRRALWSSCQDLLAQAQHVSPTYQCLMQALAKLWQQESPGGA